jgi:signal-transduction protein with cAMP-binding, CBS, and nucleotidyltransferase domain
LHEIANHIKDLSFFKEQGIEGVDMHEMCGNMSYQFYEKDDVIYNFNQDGENMYIILDGEVGFSINCKTDSFQDKYVVDVAKDLSI